MGVFNFPVLPRRLGMHGRIMCCRRVGSYVSSQVSRSSSGMDGSMAAILLRVLTRHSRLHADMFSHWGISHGDETLFEATFKSFMVGLFQNRALSYYLVHVSFISWRNVRLRHNRKE